MAIQNLYANIGADKNVVNNFITNVFGSAVSFMNYTDASTQQVATKMLEKVYTPTEMGYLRANQVWYNESGKLSKNKQRTINGYPRRHTDYTDITN